MLEFDHIWLFALLPIPLLIRWLLPAYREQKEAVQAPFFEQIVVLTGQTPSKGAVVLRRNWFQLLFMPFCWILLIAALARPQWVEDPIVKIESSRDLMIAVDLSGSMETRDFTDAEGNKIERLEAVKLVLDDFIARRKGDRVGLILFGTSAYPQVPFTLDHEIWRTLLHESRTKMAGPQTMIGDAIGLAIKLFKESESENRVLILLTDGNDTGSKVPPVRAAEIAAENGITVHTIGIGDPESAGEDALDTDTMKKIAGKAGGSFFRAMDREELAKIYDEINKLEPVDFETVSFRPKLQLYHWPLGGVLILIVGYHMIMAAMTLGRKKWNVGEMEN
jgi:Ca-activated chloride channel family protein